MSLQINDALYFLYEKRCRYKVAYGGRNGGKSHDFATALLMRGYEQRLVIVCLREYQKSLKESVHRLLSNKIRQDRFFNQFYKIQRDTIIGRNGTEFVFSGIKTAENFKSFEGCDIAWVEEAQNISQDSLDILLPTIRKDGSEVWFSFNPKEKSDPVYVFAVEDESGNRVVRDDMIAVHINYTDNPFCPELMIKEAEYCKQYNPEKYQHIWLGMPMQISDAVIFRGRFEVQDFDIKTIKGLDYFGDRDRISYRYGMDFGFSIDPTACVESFAHDGTLYVANELYAHQLDTDDIIPLLKEKVPNAVRGKIFGDSSRPETIAQLSKVRRHHEGYYLEALNIEGAIKGKGSVKDGIDYLKNFKKIIVHPRCKETIFELNNYKYKQDKMTDEIFAEIEDKHNHCIDALRYAWNREIQAMRGSNTSTKAVQAVKRALTFNNSNSQAVKRMFR